MTTIKDLPDEILLIIFKKIYFITPCQEVCRAWYSLAHPLVLRKTYLSCPSQIEKFIKSIDYNPRESYLDAVEEISLGFYHYYSLDKETIKKLLFRFPNLKNIYFQVSLDAFQDFDDEICRDLLIHCPKLDEFEVQPVYGMDDYYRDMIYKLRFLVTTIDINKKGYYNGGKYGSDLQFVENFPRLKKVVNGSISVDYIQSFLPVFAKLPRLTTFQLACRMDDQENFAERLEASDQLLIKQLSSVKDLALFLGDSSNSLMFVSKYMTGLEMIQINAQFLMDNVTQRLSFNNILDFVHSVKKCRFEIQMPPNILAEYFPIITQKLFLHKMSDSEIVPYTTLQINIHEKDIPHIHRVIINTEHLSKQHISISVSRFTNLRDLVARLFKQTALFQNVDKFVLKISRQSNFCQEGTLDMYNNILNPMPMLKELELDIPSSYTDNKPDIRGTHTKTDKVVLRARGDSNFQSFLDRSSLMFPSLKHLGIYNFSGLWKEHSGELHVQLGNYVLDSLIFDVTPVRSCTRAYLKKNNGLSFADTKEFFVIEVTLISLGERWLFKVPFCLYPVARVQDNDLKDFVRGKDYLSLHITVNTLEKLQICIMDEFCEVEKEDDLQFLPPDEMTYVNVFGAKKEILNINEPLNVPELHPF